MCYSLFHRTSSIILSRILFDFLNFLLSLLEHSLKYYEQSLPLLNSALQFSRYTLVKYKGCMVSHVKELGVFFRDLNNWPTFKEMTFIVTYKKKSDQDFKCSSYVILGARTKYFWRSVENPSGSKALMCIWFVPCEPIAFQNRIFFSTLSIYQS